MEERCDTSLTLGLGRPSKSRRQKTSPPLEPSLSLSSSAAPQKEPRTSPPLSSVSSYSTTNVKRERLEEEAEVARGSSSRASEEEDEVSVRKKLRLTKDQSALLEDRFKEHTTLNPKQKQGLAKQLNLRPRQIEVWFQNRRARTKLKQTEVDCEFLRRCCDSLTEENTRLKKEVQELKALKFGGSTATPMFVHLPAATLTVCPSCDSIAPPKPSHHFFNPFAHSATC